MRTSNVQFLSLAAVGLVASACDATLGATGGSPGPEGDGAGRLNESANGDGDGSGDGDGDGSAGGGENNGGGVVCVGDSCIEPPTNGPAYSGPGEVPMRRLNVAEYANTTLDLFAASPTGVNFPQDAREDGFDTIEAALAISEVHVEAWLDASEAIVDELFTSDPGGIAALWCDFNSADATTNVGCATQITESFAERAWRRPLSSWTDEDAIAPYRELIEASGDHILAGSELEFRLRTALSAILVSPRFVHRVELAGPDGSLDSPSLASRLSYFLWSSAPDAELLASDLSNITTLSAQATRLQEDAKFQRFIERFPALWLHLEKLDHAGVDTTIYPNYSDELGAKMKAETLEFIGSFVHNGSAPVSDILTAQSATTDPDLLQLYEGSPRSGLATQASILTLTGAGNRTSPVRRGMWVLESLLCSPPPPPPAALVAQIQEEQANVDPNLNQRERLAIHRAEPSCNACHETMDTIGLGFENFDAIGVFRTTYPNGSPVDASGVLPGPEAPFSQPEELLALLAQDERIPGCVVEKLIAYGAGRKVASQDRALVNAITEVSGGPNMSFADAIEGIVTSDGFIRRSEKTEADYQ